MNDYRPNVAAIERSRSVLEQFQKHAEKEPWEARRDRLRKSLADGGDFRVKNDLATTLAHTGAAVEAVTLLEQIEAEKPGLYMTAANLGTAYELTGNNQKALEWIRRGIERNAEAHGGTEWLHVRILEAKLAMSGDPKWLESNSITGLLLEGRNSIEISATGNCGEKVSARQAKAALIHQLHERLQFVKPSDAIVGALLLDLGELLSEERTGRAEAYDVFKLAGIYLKGLSNVDYLQDRVDIYAITAARHQRLPDARNKVLFLVFLSGAGLLLAILVIGLKRWIQRRWAGAEATARP